MPCREDSIHIMLENRIIMYLYPIQRPICENMNPEGGFALALILPFLKPNCLNKRPLPNVAAFSAISSLYGSFSP